jgi:hypothetical protein
MAELVEVGIRANYQIIMSPGKNTESSYALRWYPPKINTGENRYEEILHERVQSQGIA